MKERAVLVDFGKALIETPVTILFLALDVVGIAAVFYWVVDNFQEAVVTVIFMLVIVSGQYLIFRRLRLQLASYEDSRPLLQFSRSRQAQLYQPSSVVEGRRPTYEIVQAWFINQPINPTDTSVAKSVSARIKVSTISDQPLFDYVGMWAISNAPDNVGFNDLADTVDIAPGNLAAKLIIVLRYPGESDCFAFSRSNLQGTGDGRADSLRLQPGTYKLLVNLQGVGANVNFPLRFRNPGPNSPLELIENTT
jgi:hypothetical protein